MFSIWLVSKVWYDDNEVVCAFHTEDAARNYVAQMKLIKNRPWPGDWRVEQRPLYRDAQTAVVAGHLA